MRARVQLGALAWALGRLPEAEAALNEALRLEPAELDARLMMSALLVATGRTPAAKAAFRDALERSEDSPEIAEMYLKWLVARGDRTEAADEVARLTPDVVDENTFENIIRLQRAAGRLDAVKRTGAEAVKKGASPWRVALLVAGALVDAKDRTAAAAELARVPRTAPEFVESRLRLAEALRDSPRQADVERAGRALDDAAAAVAAMTATGAAGKPPAVPGAAAASTRGGAARSAASPDDDGAAAVEADRDWTTELTVARALWEEKRGDAVRAARTVEALIDATTDSSSSKAGEPGGAAAPAAPPPLGAGAGADSAPRLSRLLLVRGAIDERRGEWRQALKYGERILAADPRHIEALNFCGFVAVDHDGEVPLALKRLQVAMALDPGAGGLVDSVGWAYLHAGDLPRATEFLSEADRLEPGDPEIQSHLGDLLARKQELPQAIGMYRKALNSDPPERLAREINARLRALEAKSAAGR